MDRGSLEHRSSRPSVLDLALIAFLAAALLHAVYYLVVGLDNPLLDFFGFRQTQTAISAYWMMQGGPLLAYETPVLGGPWAIPFEFPIFQWIVASLASLGVPLDAAGRLTSFAFFLACLWPARLIFKDLGFDRAQYLLFAALFAFSPLYVFWARTFMIESAALFFGLLWLALMLRFTLRGAWPTLAWAALAGSLGILTKSTTFAVFGLLGALAIAAQFIRELRFDSARRPSIDGKILVRCLAAGAVCVLVLVVGLAWVRYTDELKSANLIGSYLVSSSLTRFNYGPLALRWSADLWDTAILKRALPEIFGPIFPLAFVAFGAALQSRKHALFAGLALCAAIAPMLLFSNLHRVHNYYQNANAVFAIAAVAIGVGALMSANRRILAMLLFCGIVASQLWMFQIYYRPVVAGDLTMRSRYVTGLAVKERTTPDHAILVFGNDWSSDIHYYAQRKGLAVPGWIADDKLERVLAAPEEFLGGLTLGAIVVCNLKLYGERRADLFVQFLADREIVQDLGACKIYSP